MTATALLDATPPVDGVPSHAETAVDAKSFREAMSRLAAAVTLVTTDGPAGRFGITVSAVASVTDTPPTLVVCINRGSSLHDAVLTNRNLCVNLLGDADRALALRFADRTVSPDERFAAATWRRSATGAPALADAPVAFACRIAAHREVGSHGVFFADVVEIVSAERAAGLVWFGRGFHDLASATAPTA